MRCVISVNALLPELGSYMYARPGKRVQWVMRCGRLRCPGYTLMAFEAQDLVRASQGQKAPWFDRMISPSIFEVQCICGEATISLQGLGYVVRTAMNLPEEECGK